VFKHGPKTAARKTGVNARGRTSLPEFDPEDGAFENLCDRLFNAHEPSFWEETPLEDYQDDREYDPTGPPNTSHPLWHSPDARRQTNPVSLADATQDDSGMDAIVRDSSLSLRESVGERADSNTPPDAGPTLGTALLPAPSHEPKESTNDGPVAVFQDSQPSEPPPTETAAEPQPRKRRLFNPVGIACMLGWLLLTGFCLFKGLNSPHLATKPIAEFQVGDIVPKNRIHGDNDLSLGQTVDPKTWRHLIVRAPKTDGSHAHGELLRPFAWLEARNAKVGGTVYVSVHECGIDGDAEVIDIRPCPPVRQVTGGRVVTGVWRHGPVPVVDVQIE